MPLVNRQNGQCVSGTGATFWRKIQRRPVVSGNDLGALRNVGMKVSAQRDRRSQDVGEQNDWWSVTSIMRHLSTID
jgi:hypothetical protein